ncbi:TetR/AcrR family transcriptional regulator [Mycobacteroides sp. LB1]|uniref:TetR/AcrR family transcriptional regulator n=1 Tax=Mycobacteroides sp. LB1 TaxID=2750814 RepID=UPI0015DFF5B5|nr:TetR/AcrR family transcriptional regulator [Mycobacteroides sp. LB1]
MQRFTRAESQQRTRERILSAAAVLFLGNGFRATSIGQVADAAGFSHGAVYSNFAGKTELGLAVIDLLYEREAAVLQQQFNESSATWESMLEIFSAWGAATIGDIRWARLELDVMAAASDDEEIREANALRYARLRATGAAVLSAVAERAGIELPADPNDLMIGALALALGLGLQRAADPAIPGSHIAMFLAALLPPAARPDT